ncbi:MAG: threonine/homoserine/homoserine lactone efflux protein [Alteromonas macleodii]|jgi:threonine/homoserine/homoserine lactone efflux protein
MVWKLWHAKQARAYNTDRPFTFIQAILFQWLNPKIWAVATSASVMIADLPPMVQATTLAITFSATNLCVCLFWTYAGSLLKNILVDAFKWRVFMRLTAVALATFSGLVFL